MPVSAAQVGEGLTKFASVAEMAGASIEEASAMLVGGGAISQDFSAMGNALKISTLRIRGMRGALQELGEEVDDKIESVSKIQTQILNLTSGKVNIFEDDGKTFRNIYDVYKDIATIWNDLSDTNQADLLEIIAGKTRSNQIAALMKGWSDVEKAVNVASNAEGTAREEQEKYMNSIEGKMAALETSWQALSNSILSSDLLKWLIDAGNAVLTLADNLGGLPTLFTTIAGGLSLFKNVGRGKMFPLNKYANCLMCSVR